MDVKVIHAMLDKLEHTITALRHELPSPDTPNTIAELSDKVLSDLAYQAVENILSVTKEQIKSSARMRHLVDARFIIINVLETSDRFSLAYLGKILNRHHSSIIHLKSRRQTYELSQPSIFQTINKVIEEYNRLLSSYHLKMVQTVAEKKLDYQVNKKIGQFAT